MSKVISFLAFVFITSFAIAAPKVVVESVKVVVTEAGKEPVRVTMPYWVAKGGAAITDKLTVGSEKIPMKEILDIIDNAPKLGNVMTIEEGRKKIVISIQ